MAQVLTYGTTKLFSHAILPLVMIKPRPVANANDDDPPGTVPESMAASSHLRCEYSPLRLRSS